MKYTPTPVCPHCGHAHSRKKWQDNLIDKRYGPRVEDGGLYDPVVCAKCGKLFKAIAKITLTWTTKR